MKWLKNELAFLKFVFRIIGDRISFLNEIESVRKEAQRLKRELGIGILIALGHSGYELDKKLAAEVEEIDVVVGMHIIVVYLDQFIQFQTYLILELTVSPITWSGT